MAQLDPKLIAFASDLALAVLKAVLQLKANHSVSDEELEALVVSGLDSLDARLKAEKDALGS
ncbi:MAG TPA: hypothetical protein VD948_12960 [Rhodothermales bacterium]|nr:hypothetical protein [Rhodothermales bacterium]